jgi:hypothetical protein
MFRTYRIIVRWLDSSDGARFTRTHLHVATSQRDALRAERRHNAGRKAQFRARGEGYSPRIISCRSLGATSPADLAAALGN